MTGLSDKEYMARALELAEKGRGKTSPNPMVGAVIVKDGQVIAEGFHRKVGTDHAEVVALKKAGQLSAGATVFVTLEPCCHTGATGPCCEALIEAGIKRVVAATSDPNPLVNGKGIKRLKQAGLTVEVGLMRSQAELLNDSYFGYHRNKRPFVILKAAQTLDGRIAGRTGLSQWISSSQSRKHAHGLRREADAIVVGMGTVRADNPLLTVRLVKGRNPYRVIVTGSAKLPKKCRLIDENNDGKTVIATTGKNIERLTRRKRTSGVIFWEVRTCRNGQVDIRDLTKKAEAFGLRSLLVEGGAELATSFLTAGLVDKCVFYVAPKIMGRGIAVLGELGIRNPENCIQFDELSVRQMGPDVVYTGYPIWSKT